MQETEGKILLNDFFREKGNTVHVMKFQYCFCNLERFAADTRTSQKSKTNHPVQTVKINKNNIFPCW